MSAPDALRFVRASQSAFVRDLEPLRNRIQEFQQLSLWNAEQAKVVTAVLERLKRTHTPKDMIHEKALLDLLEGDAEFIAWRKTLLPNQEFTAHLLLEPTFRLAGKSDAFWLALFFDPALRGGLSVEQGKGFASLEKIYAAHGKDLPLPTLVKLIADTLSDSNALHKKIARAQKLGLALTSDFIYRADVPLFGQAEVFHDLTGDVPLQSELDRWKLVLEDPRFHVYREAWESGRISELGVLLKAEVQMRALSQVYQIARGEGATLEPGSACRLIYGSSDGAANPLFVGLKKAGKLPTLQYRLATIYFNTFVAIAKLPTLEKVDAAFAQAVKSEDEFLRQAKQGELPETDQACEQTP